MDAGKHSPDETDELARSRQVIESQAEEITRLRSRLRIEPFAEQLREALSVASMAGTIASPVTHARLLEMIVETAAHVISARAGSLFLIDEKSQHLTFEVAIGGKAQEVRRFTVPLGHGIAGLVAVSGQPMAISDAAHDPRQASDIARSLGYVPGSILCVPLFYNDQVIGVLELLDKEGSESFTPQDMETLGLFANQAAVAIEQSRTHRYLGSLIAEIVQSLGTLPEHHKASLAEQMKEFADSVAADASYRQATELALLVQEIAWQGESEMRACRSVLLAFADYLRSRPANLSDMGSF